ncbi:hypothetical protein ECH_0463 [Ehrlichia chaffeensis str. Arkansas]|uniref:Uncharacterized protein n=1 Tax=Ehrlichia chaffeensis (strain ATCC CRL-10679 / Arkansas) TaxID=205920 RepID=Q2GH03_EHRCR|nr:hypothetical protein ECH_0463 [Ehrlichia chaffeensis str. Arkansas]
MLYCANIINYHYQLYYWKLCDDFLYQYFCINVLPGVVYIGMRCVISIF